MCRKLYKNAIWTVYTVYSFFVTQEQKKAKKNKYYASSSSNSSPTSKHTMFVQLALYSVCLHRSGGEFGYQDPRWGWTVGADQNQTRKEVQVRDRCRGWGQHSKNLLKIMLFIKRCDKTCQRFASMLNSIIHVRVGYIFMCSFRAKPQRPGLPPARPRGAPQKPRRSLPPRVTPGPLTPRVRQRPASHKGTAPGPDTLALHLEEAQVTWPGGSWAFLLPPLHLQAQNHHPHRCLGRAPVCCGWTSTVRALWRLWLASRGTRAVPISCYAGCRTGTNTTAGTLPSQQVAHTLTVSVFWGVWA